MTAIRIVRKPKAPEPPPPPPVEVYGIPMLAVLDPELTLDLPRR